MKSRELPSVGARLWPFVLIMASLVSTSIVSQAAIVRISVESKESPAFGGRSYGNAGQYEVLVGKAYGELDPKDPHNTIITDLQLAPKNARGMVEYIATFTLVKPLDLKKGNGVLLYAVPNRGNRISVGTFGVAGDSGEDFLLKRGYSILHSGWQGDVVPAPERESITVPVARNPDGSSVTGPALARFYNMPAGTHTRTLGVGREAASLDTTKAVLTRRLADDGAATVIPSADWAFADCSKTAFPGVPDGTKVSVRATYNPAYLYELRYTAKDPLVFGIGFAATRDLNSYFRYEKDGNANPMAGGISHVLAQGVSQSGNFVKTFIHLGFNQDLNNRIVWDGANDHIAGRLLALNIRFANPSGAANLYEPGSEGTLWWGKYTDKARGRAESSLLDRCTATGTCPKVIETCGSAEFWGLRISMGFVGTNADQDIPLPPNVRRYYFPGTPHGSGSGGFSSARQDPAANCELPDNPNSEAESMRALLVSLTDWVKNGTAPPESRYPKVAEGELVAPNSRSLGFPFIPSAPLPDNLVNPFYRYDFGPDLKAPDLSGLLTVQPPVITGTLPIVVPRTDSDGNEVGGIPSALHQAPLGTYTGWNIQSKGFYKGRSAGFVGGYIPFETTKAARLASGDPRPSLEERYTNHDGYVAAVEKGVKWLMAGRYLLPEDAERLMRQARDSDVLRGMP